LQRQLNIETQNTSTAKRDLNEYELRNVRLQDEISILQRDKDQLTNLISTLQQRVKFKFNFLFNYCLNKCFFSLQMKKI
jgi:hypothetical protein